MSVAILTSGLAMGFGGSLGSGSGLVPRSRLGSYCEFRLGLSASRDCLSVSRDDLSSSRVGLS